MMVHGSCPCAHSEALSHTTWHVRCCPLAICTGETLVEGCLLCRMAGLVEAWTWKVEWEVLKESCDLDDGDCARLLCRVADLLRQIAAASSVTSDIRATARIAYKRIYRQPICDLLGI